MIGIAAAVLGFGWAFLQADLFNEQRSRLLQKLMSQQIGVTVEVVGSVRVIPGLVFVFAAEDVLIPNETVEDSNFLELQIMSFQTNTVDLLKK